MSDQSSQLLDVSVEQLDVLEELEVERTLRHGEGEFEGLEIYIVTLSVQISIFSDGIDSLKYELKYFIFSWI